MSKVSQSRERTYEGVNYISIEGSYYGKMDMLVAQKNGVLRGAKVYVKRRRKKKR